MLKFSTFVIVFLISLGFGDVHADSVEFSFQNHGLVPDVVKTPPRIVLYVKYPGGEEVNFGNELTPSSAATAPSVLWEADPDSLYTLVMLDPDAPSRKNPTRRHWLHWLVGNIPGRSVGKGNVLAAYNGPSPPRGTGAHRYVFLVYKQPEKMNFDENFTATEKAKRGNFNIEKFTAKYRLGDPIAGNFFQALPHEH